MARSSRLSVCCDTAMNSSHSHWHKSTTRQRTTPWIAGVGPSSITAASAVRCTSVRMRHLAHRGHLGAGRTRRRSSPTPTDAGSVRHPCSCAPRPEGSRHRSPSSGGMGMASSNGSTPSNPIASASGKPAASDGSTPDFHRSRMIRGHLSLHRRDRLLARCAAAIGARVRSPFRDRARRAGPDRFAQFQVVFADQPTTSRSSGCSRWCSAKAA